MGWGGALDPLPWHPLPWHPLACTSMPHVLPSLPPSSRVNAWESEDGRLLHLDAAVADSPAVMSHWTLGNMRAGPVGGKQIECGGFRRLTIDLSLPDGMGGCCQTVGGLLPDDEGCCCQTVRGAGAGMVGSGGHAVLQRSEPCCCLPCCPTHPRSPPLEDPG